MAYLHVMKKTAFLITHPKDPTTKFLERLYHYLPNKTVITGGVPKSELRKKIERGDPGDRLIFCGHGCGNGLFGAGQFPDADGLIIDESFVDSLRNKPNTLFIWCNASQFVRRHSLNGFFTAMFISESSEACYYDFYDVDQETIDKSNNAFATIVARYISEPIDVLYNMVLKDYGEVAKTNPIASFNFKRLYLSQPQPVMFPDKVHHIQ